MSDGDYCLVGLFLVSLSALELNLIAEIADMIQIGLHAGYLAG